MKRMLMTMTVMLMVSSMMFGQTYSGGSGTSEAPYQIANKADLKYLSENSGEWSKHFIQTADITFQAVDFEEGRDFYNDGMGFKRIGDDYDNYYSGSYDGQGHVIDGLVIHPEEEMYGEMYPESYVGFFGSTHTDAEISNLGITNCSSILHVLPLYLRRHLC